MPQPSAEELPYLFRNQAFAICFREVRAPHLSVLRLFPDPDKTVTFLPWDVFDGVPALKVVIASHDYRPLDGAALEAVGAALRHGGLRNLQEIELVCYPVADGAVSKFMGDLKASGCSERLVVLKFRECDIGLEGVLAVAQLLCQDAFPSLKKLHFGPDVDIRDVGIVPLVEALLKATHTLLTSVVLDTVEMGDEGMIALAPLIDQSRMDQLTYLHLCGSACETDQGISALARAIEARGLPKLKELDLSGLNVENVAIQGIRDIAQTFIKSCPRLEKINLRGTRRGDVSIYSDLVRGVLRAAGLAKKVKVH